MPQTALTFELVDEPGLTFAFVVRRLEPSQIREFVGGAIERVGEFAWQHGGPLGPPMTISSAPDEEGEIVLEVGWPVAPGSAAVPPIEVEVLPRTRAAVYRHVGAYAELSTVYGELFSTLREAGLAPAANPRERYLTSPGWGETPVTEIVWPVA